MNICSEFVPTKFSPTEMPNVDAILWALNDMSCQVRTKAFSRDKRVLFTIESANPREVCKALLITIKEAWKKILYSKIDSDIPLAQRTWECISFEIGLINDTSSIESVEDQLSSFLKNIISSIVKPFDMQTLEMDFCLSLEDLKRLGARKDAYENTYRECFDFAFYQLYEPRAIPHILGEKKELPFEKPLTYESVGKTLQKWGYTQVTTPQAGDLILYIDVLGIIVHSGIFETPERVRSKWGLFPIFSHPTKTVFKSYGQSYLIFRKSAGDGFELQIDRLLDPVKRSIKDFSHQACRSPLSSEGCLWVLKQMVANMAREHQQTTEKRLPFGKSYFKQVRTEVLKLKISTSEKKKAVIKRTKAALKETLQSIHPLV